MSRRRGSSRGSWSTSRAISTASSGCAATYFPETNVLVPIDSVAEVSNTPTSKYVVITVAASPVQALDTGPHPLTAAG
jgi:hypothetical protein